MSVNQKAAEFIAAQAAIDNVLLGTDPISLGTNLFATTALSEKLHPEIPRDAVFVYERPSSMAPLSIYGSRNRYVWQRINTLVRSTVLEEGRENADLILALMEKAPDYLNGTGNRGLVYQWEPDTVRVTSARADYLKTPGYYHVFSGHLLTDRLRRL